jgi:hypothetical protein
MTVKISPNNTGNPVERLAEAAKLHFMGGRLEGLTLIGFATRMARSRYSRIQPSRWSSMRPHVAN